MSVLFFFSKFCQTMRVVPKVLIVSPFCHNSTSSTLYISSNINYGHQVLYLKVLVENVIEGGTKIVGLLLLLFDRNKYSKCQMLLFLNLIRLLHFDFVFALKKL